MKVGFAGPLNTDTPTACGRFCKSSAPAFLSRKTNTLAAIAILLPRLPLPTLRTGRLPARAG